MSLPLLRETRMPAVICEIGPATVLVEQAAGDRPGRGRLPWPSGSTAPGTSGEPASGRPLPQVADPT